MRSFRALVAMYLFQACLALTACSAAQPSASASSSPAPRSTTTRVGVAAASASPRRSHEEISAAMTTLRRYLHAWATDGPSDASRYLVRSQRFTSDQGAPRIDRGTAASYRLVRWHGPSEFTLLVTMHLHFTNDPVAWNRGSNDRFVTAHLVGRGHYLLEFATGP